MVSLAEELKSEREKVYNFFEKFSEEFSTLKKIIFLIFFAATSAAFGYWCYMLYKIYTDNDPMTGHGAKTTWIDLYHYDTHLLAAFQATVLGAFMCVVIAVGF